MLLLATARLRPILGCELPGIRGILQSRLASVATEGVSGHEAQRLALLLPVQGEGFLEAL